MCYTNDMKYVTPYLCEIISIPKYDQHFKILYIILHLICITDL